MLQVRRPLVYIHFIMLDYYNTIYKITGIKTNLVEYLIKRIL